MEDQKYHRELLVSLANCYVEVSGKRYIYYTITKCIIKVAKENIRREKTERYTEMVKKVVTQRNISQQLILTENESLENVSELEEAALAKVLKALVGDNEVFQKWLVHNSASVKKTDRRHLFRTLWV